MCDAGLYISLGVGLRLFNLLYQDCQRLDLLLAMQRDGSLNTDRQELVDMMKRAQQLEKEAETFTQQALQLQGFVDWFSANTTPTPLNMAILDAQLAEYQSTIKTLYQQAKEKVFA